MNTSVSNFRSILVGAAFLMLVLVECVWVIKHTAFYGMSTEVWSGGMPLVFGTALIGLVLIRASWGSERLHRLPRTGWVIPPAMLLLFVAYIELTPW